MTASPAPVNRQSRIDMFSTQLQSIGRIDTSFLPGGEDELASLMLAAARQMGATTVRIVIVFERAGTGRISCLIDGVGG